MVFIRRALLPVAAVVLLLVALAGQPAMARRYPPHPTKPKPTTTVAPTTTTVAPTTTTVAPTTTTVAPTTTTAAGGCSPGTPITISAGGVYSGCYESTDPAVPAVKITTAEPVTLDHATIRHAERGIVEWPNAAVRVNLTVTNSKLTALDPTGTQTAGHPAIDLDDPATFRAEHNLLTDGGGIYLGKVTASLTSLVVRYNDVVNVARYGNFSCAAGCRSFLRTQTETVAADVAWNRVTNTSGLSHVEDTINLYQSSGTGSGGRAVIEDNLINGAYGAGTGADYVGGGIIAGDNGTANWTTVAGNRVVSTSNYGVSIVGGHDNQDTGNRVVNDGKDSAGVPHGPDYAVGATVWDPAGDGGTTGPNTWAADNTIGWSKPDGTRSDTWFPACDPPGACIGNTSMAGDITAATEQAEVDAWAADLAAAGLTVGPDW